MPEDLQKLRSFVSSENPFLFEKPFGCEPAKSDRSKCRLCYKRIPYGDLRLSTRYTWFNGGITDEWYHSNCFFQMLKEEKLAVNKISIEFYKELSPDHSKELNKLIEGFACSSKSFGSIHYKQIETTYESTYMGTSTCQLCYEKLDEKILKVFFKSCFLKTDLLYGFHPACLLNEYNFSGNISDIINYKNLSEEDQNVIRDLCQAKRKRKMSSDLPSAKKNKEGHEKKDIETSKVEVECTEQVYKPSKTAGSDNFKDVLMNNIFNEEKAMSTLKKYAIITDKVLPDTFSKKNISRAYSILMELKSILCKRRICYDQVLHLNEEFFSVFPFNHKDWDLIGNFYRVQSGATMLISFSNLPEFLDMCRTALTFEMRYSSLKYDIENVEKNSAEFKKIEKYLELGSDGDIFKFDLLNLFRLKDKQEKFEDVGNRVLLWYAVDDFAYGKILSNGLKLPPADAPTELFAFGKGLRLVDNPMYLRSYCDDGSGVLLLCDVALGNNKKASYNENNTLDPEIDSICSVGSIINDSQKAEMSDEGYKIPFGNLKIVSLDHQLGRTEFILKKEEHVRIRYLVHTKYGFSMKHIYD